MVRRLPRLPPPAIAAALVAAYVPFFFTGHVQEDAYITFRCALNLVATGVYGYNPGEPVSASTSHLAVLLAAAARAVAGAAYVPVIQLLHSSAVVAAAFLIARALLPTDTDARRLWVFTALLPVSLLIGYSGMETSLVLLAFAALVDSIAADTPRRQAWTAAALLPWIRPDAVAIGVLTVAAAVVARSWRLRTGAGVVALMALSTGAWVAFNHAYFGTYLTQTMLAKGTVWSPKTVTDALTTGARQLQTMMIGNTADPGMFVPIRTRYLAWMGPLATVAIAGAGVWLWKRLGTRQRAPLLAMLLVVFAMPLCYAFTTRIYPWYGWPSAWAGGVLVLAAIVVAARDSRTALGSLLDRAMPLALAAGVVVQFVFAVSWGTQEQLYRGGIGRTIHAMSSEGDTLLLEPAGYVPYFAELRTDDEIGLGSPKVTSYRQQYGSAWWPQFVRDVQPTFILEREPMAYFTTLDGYALSSSERAWFTQHYTLVTTFTYTPDRLRTNALARAIARLGSAGGYRLYRIRDQGLGTRD